MMKECPKTKEPQYAHVFKDAAKHGISQFGLMANGSWNEDPRRVLFTLARYKFVSKMLSGKNSVLEVGCADAFGTRLVQQEVSSVTAVDFDPVFIADAESRSNSNWPLALKVHNMLDNPVQGSFDAVYCLDVLEHISPADEDTFVRNMIATLELNGVAIIGMPSIESQQYASPGSKEGHVNCKSGAELKKFALRYFHNVFMFSMNDEVVHTGFFPMAHYLFAVCCSRR